MDDTKKTISAILVIGCKSPFKPFRQKESPFMSLEVTHPAIIIDGLLIGSAIDIYDESTFRIWTSHKTKANAYARRYNLIISNLDGECVLLVPGTLADELLPKFGAKVKRVISAATNAHLKSIGFKKRTLE